jgi:hypothetical protein
LRNLFQLHIAISFPSIMQMTARFPFPILTDHSHHTQPNRSQEPPAVIPSHTNRRFPDVNATFRGCIQAFMKHVEANVPAEYSVSHLLVTFHVQKRRMYDVTSVFTVVGSCEKPSTDIIRWIGLSKIPFALRRMQFDAGVDLLDLSFDAIIGSCDLLSISSLTIQFFLCFLTLRMTTLDIRNISRYLSRKTGRHKSTLCKLYQIAHILEAANIFSRSESPGQVTIAERFFVPVDISLPSGSCRSISPFSIEAILNHPNPTQERVTFSRQKEFFAELAKKSSEAEVPPS